jgi:hypothetical protein
MAALSIAAISTFVETALPAGKPLGVIMFFKTNNS